MTHDLHDLIVLRLICRKHYFGDILFDFIFVFLFHPVIYFIFIFIFIIFIFHILFSIFYE